MAQRIPQAFIDELLTRTDVVELVNAAVPLKKAGRNYSACCPFHNEKSPSFTVSREKQFYHCFGCGAHGNAISFLMEYHRMGFIEAVESLADQANLTIPRQAQDPEAANFQGFYDTLAAATRYYQQALRKARPAIDYLKHRGLSSAIVNDFAVGFAPEGWSNLLDHLQQHNKNPKQLLHALKTTGMVISKSDTRHYDRFRDRIMFPIRDRRGRVIAFGGRVMGDEQPKYLNSPETPIFHKGQALYGLYEALQANRKLSQLVIVEGYMDVIALAQFDIRFAVATLGTATTANHIQFLFRQCNQITFCFDGDKAGLTAAWRAVETLLPILKDGQQVKFMFLPEGDDPDSTVRREGKTGFMQRLDDSTPFSEFFFQHLEQQVDMNHIDGRAQLASLAAPLLRKIPGGIMHELMEQTLAERLQISAERLDRLIQTAPQTEAPPSPTPATAAVTNTRRQLQGLPTRSPMRVAIALLLQHPHLAKLITHLPELESLNQPGSEVLCQILRRLQKNPELNTAALLEAWRNDEKLSAYLVKLATWELMLPEEGLEQEFLGSIERLTSKQREQLIQALLQKSANGQLNQQERSQLQALLAEHNA